MESEEIRSTLAGIYNQYPWASEDTVTRMASLSRSSNIKTTALAVALQQVTGISDAKELNTYMKNQVQNINKEISSGEMLIKNLTKSGKDISGSLYTGSSGIESMTTFAGATAEALDHAAGALTGTLGTGKAATAVKWMTSATTGSAVALTGVAAVFATLITEQEKQVRAMIDLGLVMGNIDNYTLIRGQAADAGMTLKDYAGIMQATSAMIVGASGDMTTGVGTMHLFLTDDNMVKNLKHFGYTPKELSQQLANESIELFQLNEVNELNLQEQLKVSKTFRMANEMGMYMADTLGVQRSAMLESRKIVRENIDFQLAMSRNREYLEEQYGEGAAENVRSAGDFLSMFFSATLGNELAGKFGEVFVGTVGDIQLDESPINNMLDSAFTEQLQLLGPRVFSTAMKLIQDSATGQLGDSAEQIMAGRNLLKLIKESRPLIGYSDSALAVNELIATVTTIPNGLFEGTVEEINAKLAITSSAIDGADDSIIAVGTLTRGFLQAQHALTPGFESMGTVMHVLDSTVGRFTDFWLDMFGGTNANGDPNTMTDVMLDYSSQVAEAYRLAPGQTRGGSGVVDVTTPLADNSLTVADAEQRVADATANVERLESEYDAAVAAIYDYEGGAEVDQVLIDGLQSDLETARTALQVTRRTAMTSQADLLNEFKELQSEQMNLTSSLSSIGVEGIQNQISDQESLIETLKVSGEGNQAAMTEDALEVMNTELDVAENALEEMNTELEAAQLQADNIQAALEVTQDNLVQNETQREELQTGWENGQARINELIAQIELANQPDLLAVQELEKLLDLKDAELESASVSYDQAVVDLEQVRLAEPATINVTSQNVISNYGDNATLQGIMISELAAQGITSPQAQANILGMMHGESGFQAIPETSYSGTSNQRIRDVMGDRVSDLSDPALTALKADDEAFYNHVYEDLGGYAYRGRGLIQLTGEANYAAVGELIGEDLLNNPDLMLDPEISARASAAYFAQDHLRGKIDQLDEMSTVYQIVFGRAAEGAVRRADLATRQGYARQFKSAMESGELTASTRVSDEVVESRTATVDLQNEISDIKDIDGDGIENEVEEGTATHTRLLELEEQLAAEMIKLEQLMESSNG